MKTKTITVFYLTDIHRPFDKPGVTHRVDHVTDSIDYHPGEYLTKAQVDELCIAKAWKVTVKGLPR